MNWKYFSSFTEISLSIWHNKAKHWRSCKNTNYEFVSASYIRLCNHSGLFTGLFISIYFNTILFNVRSDMKLKRCDGLLFYIKNDSVPKDKGKNEFVC